MVAQSINAGMNTARGASQYTRRSADDGRMSSLTTSFIASASGWSVPWKPTRIGPIRIWIRASPFRSTQVSTSTITDRKTKSAIAPRP